MATASSSKEPSQGPRYINSYLGESPNLISQRRSSHVCFAGHHTKRLNQLSAYWASHPKELERQQAGAKVWEALKRRKDPFYMCDDTLDCVGE